MPPQILKACPVMAADSSEASSIAIGTISPGCSRLPIGVRLASSSENSIPNQASFQAAGNSVHPIAPYPILNAEAVPDRNDAEQEPVLPRISERDAGPDIPPAGSRLKSA